MDQKQPSCTTTQHSGDGNCKFYICLGLHTISNLKNAFMAFHCHLPKDIDLSFTRLFRDTIYIRWYRLHYFAAKVIQKHYVPNFYQNQPSFVEDVSKTFGCVFFVHSVAASTLP